MQTDKNLFTQALKLLVGKGAVYDCCRTSVIRRMESPLMSKFGEYVMQSRTYRQKQCLSLSSPLTPGLVEAIVGAAV